MEPKITLYEHISYGGRSQDFTESCPDLDEYDFDDITSSAKCNRGVWILYSEKYYQGNIFVVQDGEDYNDNLCDNFNDYASSIRLLDNFDFTEESKCTIYKDNNFLGRSLTFRDDVPNLKLFNLDDEMSSVVVKSGAWVGFTECNYEGEQSLFLSGRYTV
ncbi:beta-crystallin A3-like [Mytilus trossulus]|uniref:beta-crystallin A3-like n=1 Tax=Mytilus trossulus TaxID=6551 RepID=UPI00300514CD